MLKKIKITFIILSKIIVLLSLTTNSYAILEVKKKPYDDAEIEKIYKLDNGKFIYIEQFVRGHIIWEYNPETDKFKEISKVWTFIDLASKCEMVEGHNIYFANILEYWFAGGTIIDYPEIRIFSLYEPNPWRNTDLGISPDMSYAKKYCNFYTPYYTREK